MVDLLQMNALDTPVLFLVFNRPDTTAAVFEAIRKARPKQLFVAADGPRGDKPGEDELCKKVRDIVTCVDWDCKLQTLFREQNLGCGKAVSSAISWFFENVEEGIILEDDCLPDLSFFNYCAVLLERYRDNRKVMHIGGTNLQFGRQRGEGSYYFSLISHVWGWATWKRAWDLYEFDLRNTGKITGAQFETAFNHDQTVIKNYKDIFDLMRKGEIDTWDYQWFYSIILNNGVAVSPNVNMIQNIGFRNDGTHTINETDWNKLNIAKPLYNFDHPANIGIDFDADAYTFTEIMQIKEENDLGTRVPGISTARKILFPPKIKNMIKRIWNKLKRMKRNSKLFQRTDHKKIFSKIYDQNVWGNPNSESPFYSGTGSDDSYTETYSSMIAKFIAEQGIDSMVDLGCGDFRVGRRILDKANIKYTGVDVVPELIEYNISKFSGGKINFKRLNIVNDNLPPGELCTIRQVLQHLSNKDIQKVLRKCKQFKYLIVTEHLPETESLHPNMDKSSDENIRLMYNSGVYLDKPPFNFKVKEILAVRPEIEEHSKIVTFRVWVNEGSN